MKKVFFAVLVGAMLTACTDSKQTKTEENMSKLELTTEWDKKFPKSNNVNHQK